MYSPLFTVFVSSVFVALALPKHVTAHQALYTFPGAKNCSVYDHALIRVGSKVAHRMSIFKTEDDNEVDEEEFYLNEFNSIVPSIRITYLNIEKLKIEYSIDNDDMELLIQGKNVILDEGHAVPRQWELRLASTNAATNTSADDDDEVEEANRFLRESTVLAPNLNNTTDHRNLRQSGCCACKYCNCCSDEIIITCAGTKCNNRRMLKGRKQSKSNPREVLLADIARPVFKLMNIPCLKGHLDDLKVIIA